MAKNVVCKKCNNLVTGWCEKVIDSPDPDMQRDCQHFCEKTNADRVRAMSDDELAEFLIDLADDGNLKIREWLQQPTKRDELIRALRYDREQYQKGFDDAREDAVVVTRCKDCEHLVNATVNGNGFLICDISDMETAPDDFCSYGERRDKP